MRLQNLLHPSETVTFAEAVLRGIGTGGGLYFPGEIPPLPNADQLLTLELIPRSVAIAQHLLADELTPAEITEIIGGAFSFPAPLVSVREGITTLELFHGPTLAFKDFGARFLARVIQVLRRKTGTTAPLTILSATSGDTGAAVAHAFYRLPGVRVVILYPAGGRISALQEKLFCTLGDNIHTIAVDGDFDACQALVKTCFADPELVLRYGLNSANSINIARLLAQVFYYFEALAQVPENARRQTVVSVPSGNFGNVTAGLLARALGLPVKRFIVATNANDTVPRYLSGQPWEVRPTVATLSNAMDVSAPNNWPRVQELLARAGAANILQAVSVNENTTRAAVRELWEQHQYLSEPHGAVAYAALRDQLQPLEYGLFLGTAHPAKFQGSVEEILGISVALPPALAAVADQPVLSSEIAADAGLLRVELARVLR